MLQSCIDDRISLCEALATFDYDPYTGIIKRKTHQRWHSKTDTIDCTVSLGEGYRAVKYNGVYVRAHALAWVIHNRRNIPPGMIIDHKNGDTSDNRASNLRCSTQAQNIQSQSISKNNKTGVKNVSYSKTHNKFRVDIMANGKRKNFGWFDTLGEASEVATEARKLLHLEFAKDR